MTTASSPGALLEPRDYALQYQAYIPGTPKLPEHLLRPTTAADRKAKRRAQNRESQKAFRKRKAEQEDQMMQRYSDLTVRCEQVEGENTHLRQLLDRARQDGGDRNSSSHFGEWDHGLPPSRRTNSSASPKTSVEASAFGQPYSPASMAESSSSFDDHADVSSLSDLNAEIMPTYAMPGGLGLETFHEMNAAAPQHWLSSPTQAAAEREEHPHLANLYPKADQQRLDEATMTQSELELYLSSPAPLISRDQVLERPAALLPNPLSEALGWMPRSDHPNVGLGLINEPSNSAAHNLDLATSAGTVLD